jgi:peptidoglycan L-alanyl-D-glutamate endopeptidase CwlK
MSILSFMPIIIVFAGSYLLIKLRAFFILHPIKTLLFTFNGQKQKENIKSFQTWLNKYFNSGLTVDGAYGNNTKKASVKAWQQSSNELFNTSLAIDGDYGDESKKAASKIVIKKDSYNRFVYILQGMLNCHGYVCEFTGKCTSATVTQIKAFQRAKGLTADGVVGQNTWNKIFS